MLRHLIQHTETKAELERLPGVMDRVMGANQLPRLCANPCRTDVLVIPAEATWWSIKVGNHPNENCLTRTDMHCHLGLHPPHATQRGEEIYWGYSCPRWGGYRPPFRVSFLMAWRTILRTCAIMNTPMLCGEMISTRVFVYGGKRLA